MNPLRMIAAFESTMMPLALAHSLFIMIVLLLRREPSSESISVSDLLEVMMTKMMMPPGPSALAC